MWLKGSLHPGPQSCSMSNGHFLWSHFHCQFYEKYNYKAFGPLTRCKQDVNQVKWPCTKKWTCSFFLIYAPKGIFFWPCCIFSPFSSFSPLNYINGCQKKNIKIKQFLKVNYIWIIFLYHGPVTFVARESLFHLSCTTKHIGPWQWIM